MRKIKILATCLSAIFLSSLLPLQAQKHMDEWIKKCESSDLIEITVINNKNKETGVLERTLINISMKKDSPMRKELLAAVEKDKSGAIQLIEKKINGTMHPEILKFEDIQYIFSYGKETIGVVAIPKKSKKTD